MDLAFLFELLDGAMRSSIAIQRDAERIAVLAQGPAQKAFGGIDISAFAEPKVHGAPLAKVLNSIRVRRPGSPNGMQQPGVVPGATGRSGVDGIQSWDER